LASHLKKVAKAAQMGCAGCDAFFCFGNRIKNHWRAICKVAKTRHEPDQKNK